MNGRDHSGRCGAVRSVQWDDTMIRLYGEYGAWYVAGAMFKNVGKVY